MKATSLLPLLALALPATLSSQDLSAHGTDAGRDPLITSLSADDGAGPAVTVDISATADLPAKSPAPPDEPSVLVTGHPPADAHLLEDSADGVNPAVPEAEGVSVRVEPGPAGTPVRPLPASEVKLIAPFPAKMLSAAPRGWRLEHPENVPPFIREVDLANGTRLSLTIRPHLLVPDADGVRTFAVEEPGYDPALEYSQTHTVGAILADSVRNLEDDSRQLGEALGQLEQLLGSLPSPSPATTPSPAPAKPPETPARSAARSASNR